METSPEDPSHSQLRDFLRGEQGHYSVDRCLAARLGDISVMAVAGPASSGKSTLIERTIALDPDIHLYQSSTTRSRLPGDDSHYRTDVPLQEFADGVRHQTLVNYAERGGHFFGTFIDGFRAPVTIGSISPDNVEQLDYAGFRDVRTIFTVMTGETYASRLKLDTLHLSTQPNLPARLEDSLELIDFARRNNGEDWLTPVELTNKTGGLDRAAHNLSRIAHGHTAELLSDTHVNRLLDEMKAVAREAIQRLSVQ